jgi:hypothetical protein
VLLNHIAVLLKTVKLHIEIGLRLVKLFSFDQLVLDVKINSSYVQLHLFLKSLLLRDQPE